AVRGWSVSASSSGAVTLTLAVLTNGPERTGSAPQGKPAADAKEQKCPDYPTCGAGVVYKGQDGEKAVRAVEDIGEKRPILINGRRRIPDGVNRRTKVLTEVKNVRQLSYTRQLRDLADYAKQEGLRFDLWVPEGAKLSGPLDEQVGKTINLRHIP